jgi:hypothetical protein
LCYVQRRFMCSCHMMAATLTQAAGGKECYA